MIICIPILLSCSHDKSVSPALVQDQSGPELHKGGTNVVREPVDDIVYNDCTNEDVHLVGEVQYFSETRDDGAGGYHVNFHTNFYLKGVGLSSGTQYIWNTENNGNENVSPPFPAMFSYTRTRHVVAQGKATNQHLTVRQQFTINANGDVTVDRYEFSLTCQ